jgi:hypothetical protein
MNGKSKAITRYSHKYYPIRTTIPQQHYHGNGYNSTNSKALFLIPKSLSRKDHKANKQTDNQDTNQRLESNYQFKKNSEICACH